MSTNTRSPKARLKDSREAYFANQRSRGRDEGVAWAENEASYGELKRLSESWPLTQTCETNDAHGAPGVFISMIAEVRDDADRQAINDFWVNLATDNDEDKYSAHFWDGFTEGAVEVFESIDEPEAAVTA